MEMRLARQRVSFAKLAHFKGGTLMQNMAVAAHVPPELVRDFNLFQFPGSDLDIHKAWRTILENEPPVFFTPWFGGFWVLNRAELLEAAWPDTELLCSGEGIGIPPNPKEYPPMLPIEEDDPVHQLMRRPLNIALSPRAVNNLAPAIRSLTAEIVNQLKTRGECEFINDFALKVPMEVFLRLVNLPLSDREYLTGLAHDGIKNADIARRGEATLELFQYISKWVKERSENPGNDLLSSIVNMDVGGRPLTEPEKLGYVANTLFGGLDTVATTISMIIKHLAQSDGHRRHLAAHPAEIPSALEELLRRFSIPTVGRTLTRDATIAGVQMKKGDRVMLATMLHGLDERRWPDAMSVKLGRSPKDHMAFGRGTHRCPGANLARLELRIFLEEWLKGIPDFVICKGATVRYESGPVAGIVSLPLSWALAPAN